ncbi:MAG: 5-oxoprolinase subunit PxpB [Alphaproteobacteria bacterium]|nr:5-oxoprolinase subunit PxpB [Alphaproteobacteria bacterium]
MTTDVRIKPAGDSALVVEFEERIDQTVSARVLELDRAVLAGKLPGVLETLPTYRTLLVRFDPLASDAAAIAAALEALAATARGDARPGRLWHVPVAYGGVHGEDLAEMARVKGLTTAEVIALHRGAVYHVYMLGFVPGYAYLGGLDPRLHLSRRENPRLKVPAGTIGIGGQQAGIQSIEAPSGWHLLGRTPARLFDMRRADPFLLKPGERVSFEPITPAEFDRLDGLAERGETVAEAQS